MVCMQSPGMLKLRKYSESFRQPTRSRRFWTGVKAPPKTSPTFSDKLAQYMAHTSPHTVVYVAYLR
jgi:hypothetical protein